MRYPFGSSTRLSARANRCPGTRRPPVARYSPRHVRAARGPLAFALSEAVGPSVYGRARPVAPQTLLEYPARRAGHSRAIIFFAANECGARLRR